MKPFRKLVTRIIDALNIGVAVRNSYHYLKYVLNLRAVAENRRLAKAMGFEGPSFPPPRLIHRVAGHFSVDGFLQSGLWSANFIKTILGKNGLDINSFPAILDFGCGCGQVFRHWRELAGPKLHGCDHQRSLVRWCQKNLDFGRFSRNGLLSQLAYPDKTFGFIYAISIFTHLDEKGQNFWINELFRVLKDGGYLMITVHGTTRLAELSAEELELFDSGKPVFHQTRYSGANVCAVYHPRKYIQDTFGRRFRLMDFLPGGAVDANQDVYLFRKD